MFHVEPSQHYLKNFLQNHHKQNNYYLIPEKQIKTIQQLIDQIIFTTFQKSQSFLIILLRRLVLEMVHRKLSIPLLQQIFQLIKQYEIQIKNFKQYFFQLQDVMFQQQKQFQDSNLLIQTFQTLNLDLKNQSMQVNRNISQSPQLESKLCISPRNQRYAKSLIMDIQCFSQDSKHNILSRYEDKYFCSQYLTTSEDQKQCSQQTAFKNLKQKLQNKLKLEPLVSAFNYGIKNKQLIIDYDQELKQWKRAKQSILKQPSFHEALLPNQFDQNLLASKMKTHHYRQKIKSVLVKKRLSTKHPIT